MLPIFHRAGPRVTLGSREILPFVSVPFNLDSQALASHIHCMGTTGVGKSKLLAHVASQLILQGGACSVIDPHTDLATDVLRLLMDAGYYQRPDALQRVWYVDFSSRQGFIPFNVLKQPYSVDEVARNLVEACTRAWPALADGNAPQFENVLLAASVVLIENGLPVTEMTRLLTNKAYREQLLARVRDGQVVSFFHDRFDQLGKETPLLIESTLRRVFLLSFTPALRYTLGQRENVLDFRRLMDEQVSLIVNLEGLDEQAQRLLGCLITVGFEVAALSREDLSEEKRVMYHLLLDEFSMFAAQSEEALSRVLSLARKYRLFLVLAHQTWSQVSERLQGALQNSLPIYFRLGYDDAVWAAPRLGHADPCHVKHQVRGLRGQDLPVEHHPIYFHQTEEYAAWARQIENLWPQQAFVKVNRHVPRLLQRFWMRSKTYAIRTATIPQPKHSHEQVQAMKETYAGMLLTPLSQITQKAPHAPINPQTGSSLRLRVTPLLTTARPVVGINRVVRPRLGPAPAALQTGMQGAEGESPRRPGVGRRRRRRGLDRGLQ
jgi:hypothetical protein